MVSFVPVWVQFELGQLGIFANSFVDSLGWLLQGEFVVFPWSFRWIPMSFSLLSFQMSLAGSTISPNDFREALTGPMSFPSAVQVSVDFHVVHPSFSTTVGCSRLEDIRDVLVSSPEQPRGLVRTQGRRTL